MAALVAARRVEIITRRGVIAPPGPPRVVRENTPPAADQTPTTTAGHGEGRAKHRTRDDADDGGAPAAEKRPGRDRREGPGAGTREEWPGARDLPRPESSGDRRHRSDRQ